MTPSGPYITPISVRPCPPALSAIRGFPPLRPPYIRRMCLIFTSATTPAVTIITPLPTRSTSKTCKRPGSAERDPESVRGPSHSAAFPAGRTLVSPSHASKMGWRYRWPYANGARPIIRPEQIVPGAFFMRIQSGSMLIFSYSDWMLFSRPPFSMMFWIKGGNGWA